MKDEWHEVRLGDLILIKHGWPFKSNFFSEERSGGPIVVNIGNFRYTGGFRFEETQVKEYRGEYLQEYELSPGDILLVMTCQTSGGEILGLPARIPNDGRIYLHNQRMGKVVVTQPALVDYSYLYWLFLWSEFNKELALSASGTKILHTAPGRIEAFRFQLPTLSGQRTLAQILGTLDDKIELNRRMNETLEAIVQVIFKSWFVDFDPVRAKASGEAPDAICRRLGLTRDLLALFPDSFQESELGEIPKGWEVEPFSKLARLNTESVKPYEQPETVWEHYSIPAFDQGQQPVFEKGQDIKSNKYRVEPTAILSSKLNPHFPRTWLPCVAHPNVAICSTEFMPFVPHDRIDRTFIYELVCSSSFQAALSERVTGTTGSRQRAIPSSVMSASFTIPAVTLRHSFSHLVAPLHGKQTQTIAESGKLVALRDILLPKLLSGELRVKEAEKVVEAVA